MEELRLAVGRVVSVAQAVVRRSEGRSDQGAARERRRDDDLARRRQGSQQGLRPADVRREGRQRGVNQNPAVGPPPPPRARARPRGGGGGGRPGGPLPPRSCWPAECRGGGGERGEATEHRNR